MTERTGSSLVLCVDAMFAAQKLARLEENRRGKTARLVPVDETRWTMFGGNYGATSDSRFSEAVRAIYGGEFYGAVPIHDRTEG